MHQFRQIISRMRLGQSDRDIAQAEGVGRKTVAKVIGSGVFKLNSWLLLVSQSDTRHEGPADKYTVNHCGGGLRDWKRLMAVTRPANFNASPPSVAVHWGRPSRRAS